MYSITREPLAWHPKIPRERWCLGYIVDLNQADSIKMTRTKFVFSFALFRLVVVAVGVVIGATAASNARAGDYQVAYAIDARGLTESGKNAECIYKQACRLNFEQTSIRILVIANRGPRTHLVLVSIPGTMNCCFFADGGDTISLNVFGDKPYHQLAIFEGRRRLGNEFVLNRKIGDIFLAFGDFR